MNYDLLYQLMRLAVGGDRELSDGGCAGFAALSAGEWKHLFELAGKQAVTGVCFAGLQKLNVAGGVPVCGERLYFHWMGTAARINVFNEEMDRKCAALYGMFSEDGMSSCVLKGQGVAKFYGELSGFRQPGDIDLWVMPAGSVRDDKVADTLEQRRRAISLYCRGALPGYDPSKEGKLHTSYPIFEDAVVEVHFTPSTMSDPFLDRRLQAWFEGEFPSCRENLNGDFCTPTLRFNLVYLLLHIFRHMLYEGIGLRQIMDYYFVTLHSTREEREWALSCLNDLGADRFAGGLVWVMERVLALDGEYFLCAPDERHGRLLLSIIEEGGNFGHYSKSRLRKGATARDHAARYLKRNAKLIWYYPGEVVWHFLRKAFRSE